MSKYFTAWDNFAVDTIGSAIVGWTARGSDTPTRPPAYGTSVPFKRRYLAFTPSSAADHACVTWDAIDADADRDDFDILTLVVLPHATSTVHNIYARGAGSAPATDYYRAKALYSGGNLTISIEERVASASVSSLASTALGAWGATTSFWFRFRGNGTSLSATAWAVGTTEPTTPTVSVTDGSLTAAGWCGLGGAGSGLVSAFNFFAIGTNGDVAVRPRSNTEYTAWLASQEALRVITARLAFTGYDSSGSPFTATRYAYISDHGYTSAEQDTPARQHFDNYIRAVPTFSREMPAALSGQAVVNFGEMRVKNPAVESVLRQNLLNYSNYNASRLTDVFALATFTTGQADPAGGTSAVRIDLSAAGTKLLRLTPGYTLTARGQYKFTMWMKLVSGSAGTFTADINDVAGSSTNVGAQLVTGQWVQVTLNAANFATDTTLAFVDLINNTTGTFVVDVCFMHLRQASRSDLYIATTGSAYNPPAPSGTPGMLDDWLRVHWIRDGFEMQLGAPDWPLHDFRHVVRGRLGLPTAPRPDEMVFRIADMSDAFNAPISTRFTTGLRVDDYKPKLFGNNAAGEFEPPRISTSPIEYQLHAGAVVDSLIYTDVKDNQVSLKSTGLTMTAANAGTDVMTASAAHGMVTGYRFILTSTGVPPAPLVADTEYWAIVTSTTEFKAASSLANALANTPINLTDAGTLPNDLWLWGWTTDDATGVMTLAAEPTPGGRVTVLDIQAGSSPYSPAYVYSDIMFASLGLSLNYKDTAAFAALAAAETVQAAIWFDTSLHVGRDVIAQLAAGTLTWYGPTSDGLIQVGLIELPAATARLSFVASDIRANSLRLVDTVRPVDFSKAVVTYGRFYLTAGPLTVGDANALRGKSIIAFSSYSTGTPLDNYPASGDANQTAVYDMVYAGAAFGGPFDLFTYTLGIYEFDTTLPASELNIGDTISLDFPRLGWKQWSSADPASPDNTATIDSRLAVVIGLNVNLSAAGPFKVKVKCFRRQPGYYPTANLN